jgi:PAS domain S-box-containing protein
MIVASIPDNESERLATFASYQILDTPPEPQFDDLAILAAQICQTPIALVSLVDATRQWFKSKVGVTACETPRDWAFCAHALHEKDMLLVPDALADQRFAKNPLVTSDPYIRFYAGIPLRTKNGHVLGTLCVIDRVSRELTGEQQLALKVLARQVVAQLELRRHLLEQEHVIRLQRENISATAAIKDKEERLRLVIEAAPSGMVMIDQQGTIVLVNHLILQQFGYVREELLGHPIEWLIPTRFRGQHPAHRAKFFANPSPRGMGQGRELYGLRQDGSEFPIEIGLNPLRTEQGIFVLASIVDITQRKEAENALKELSLRNALLLSSAGEGIYGLDTQGLTTFVNPAAANMLGYSPEELIGKPMHPTMHHTKTDGSPYPREECPMYAAIHDGTVHRIENELLWRKDGTSFPVSYTSTPVKNDQDQILGAVVTFNDITQRKQSEQALLEWTTALEHSNKELDDFAYIASHDLKEPLRGIYNYSTILLEDYGDALQEGGRTKCETLIRLSQRMENLINSLFNFSRAGRTELAIGSTHLQPIIEEILDSLAIGLEERGISVKIAKSLPTIECDRVRVREIFLNLITNAMKYSDKEEKWVEIGWIEPEEDGQKGGQIPERCPVFYVRDNGIGIREKHIKNIFRIFKRLHGRDKFGGGTGMGLTITKKLIERHGGELWVESMFGEGSTFYFTLQRSAHHVSLGEPTYSVG